MRTDRMYRVWAQQANHSRVLLAKFRMRIDADVYADSVRKFNPTWHVEVSE